MTPNSSHPLEPGDYSRVVEVAGESRSYLLHVPAAYNPTRPAPLVLAFHGGGSTAADMVGFSGLNDKANEAGFLVVYPNGSGRSPQYLSWNAGNCCGYAARYGVDDVEFTRRLLADLERSATIDQGRIFATGMSNGGALAYRLADELADRFAAIAPVGGAMGAATCNPSRPVSVIHFHGTDDQFVPLAGGIGRKSFTRVRFPSLQESLGCWIAANGCEPTFRTEQLPTPLDPQMPITRRTWGPGRDGAEVVSIVVQGGGHTWPGRISTLTMLGRSTLDVSASDLMWEFFQRHARTKEH